MNNGCRVAQRAYRGKRGNEFIAYFPLIMFCKMESERHSSTCCKLVFKSSLKVPNPCWARPAQKTLYFSVMVSIRKVCSLTELYSFWISEA